MEKAKSYQQLLAEQCTSIVQQVLEDMEKNRFHVGTKPIPVPKSPILYRWWFPEKSAVMDILTQFSHRDAEMATLLQQFETRKIENKTYYALYFGKSNNGYRRYIQHSTGNVHTSTLRHTLYGLCLTEKGEKQYIKERDKEEITRMLQECYYEWIPFENEDKLVECVESICIALGKYPLNVDGNPAISDQWREYVMDKRKLKE